MEDLEEAGDATTPESREILLKVVQHTIFTWIIIEYYHSFSLLVLCIRAVQAFASFRPKPVLLDALFVKGMGTVLVVLQLLSIALQLLSSHASPIMLVFVGYTQPPSFLGMLVVQCIIGALLYTNFVETVGSALQPAPLAEADVELGLRRMLHRRRRGPG